MREGCGIAKLKICVRRSSQQHVTEATFSSADYTKLGERRGHLRRESIEVRGIPSFSSISASNDGSLSVPLIIELGKRIRMAIRAARVRLPLPVMSVGLLLLLLQNASGGHRSVRLTPKAEHRRLRARRPLIHIFLLLLLRAGTVEDFRKAVVRRRVAPLMWLSAAVLKRRVV